MDKNKIFKGLSLLFLTRKDNYCKIINMKNFVLISPNFPETYYQFAVALRNVGFRVLGIGDQPYDELKPELREALHEYYKVNVMDNFDEEKEAVGYFERKYGHIDFLESNNEYWLRKDARLRDLFWIDTGLREHELDTYQRKSMMKACFEKAGVKVAPYILVSDFESLEKFAEKNGYPLFVKPDIGVGAEESFKISNFDELKAFYDKKPENVQYICEIFVSGDIVTFDGIADQNSNVVFMASLECPPSISDVLIMGKEFCYYSNPFIDEKFEEIGRKTVKAFGLKKRCFHIEFFRVNKKIKGFVDVGDIVGLEVNIRTPGGYSPDMHNYANSVNMYQIYADTMADLPPRPTYPLKYYCATASRRDNVEYFYTDDDVKRTYANELVGAARYPDVLSGVMGNRFFMAKFNNIKDVMVFNEYVSRKTMPEEPKTSKGSRSMFKKGSSKENICDTHIDGA